MSERDDPHIPPDQPRMESASRNRPPQFNWRNCGFDCGFGCEKASEEEGGGGGGGGSDDETAVDENEILDLAAVLQFENNEVGHEHPNSSSDNDLSPDEVEVEGSSSLMDSNGYLDHMSGSLHVGQCATTDHSPGASTRNRSPDPGIPYWIAGLPVAPELPFAYYFLETPLRLSPQYEHCRGDPASHLVVPDRTSWSFLMEQTWRGYMPTYGYVSPPHIEGW